MKTEAVGLLPGLSAQPAQSDAAGLLGSSAQPFVLEDSETEPDDEPVQPSEHTEPPERTEQPASTAQLRPAGMAGSSLQPSPKQARTDPLTGWPGYSAVKQEAGNELRSTPSSVPGLAPPSGSAASEQVRGAPAQLALMSSSNNTATGAQSTRAQAMALESSCLAALQMQHAAPPARVHP